MCHTKMFSRVPDAKYFKRDFANSTVTTSTCSNSFPLMSAVDLKFQLNSRFPKFNVSLFAV